MVNEDRPEDIYSKIGDENVEIIDVRENEELQQTNNKTIPGSKHIPFSELPKKLDEIEYKDELYIICRHGNSSVMACRILESYEKSINTYISSIEGGFLDWEMELKEIHE